MTQQIFDDLVESYSPLAWWKLGLDTSDHSGHGNNGTIEGTVTLGNNGPIGSLSALFDGSTGWIDTSFIGTTSPYTLIAWFNYTTATSYGMLVSQQGSGGELRESAGLNYNNGSSASPATGAAYNDGNWHFIAVTVSASEVIIYVDGPAVASAANSAVYESSCTIGSRTGSYFYEGYLAEVAFLPGALSAGEVGVLASSTNVIETATPGTATASNTSPTIKAGNVG